MSETNAELIAKAMKPETDPLVLAERLRKRSVDEGETEGNSLYRDSANAIEAAGAERDAVLNVIATVIADLDRARANGTIYTYGNIQTRLGHILAGWATK